MLERHFLPGTHPYQVDSTLVAEYQLKMNCSPFS